MKYEKKNNSYIVRKSNNELYHFFIEDKNIVLSFFEDGLNFASFIVKYEIDEFSLEIDENDVIHIVYLSKNKLKYCTYPSTIQDAIILSLSESSIIKDLSIKVISSSIHIFYIQNKAGLNLNFIYHSYLYDNHWRHIQIEDINCEKYENSYHIDQYNNDIYLLFSKYNILHNFKIKKFSLKNKVWADFDSNIYIDDITNLNFLITNDNIGILCFSQSINKNLQVMVKYKNFNNTKTAWSPNINISMNNVNSVKPKAFLKHNTVHAIWGQGDNIVHKKSKDLSKWEDECTIGMDFPKRYTTYISNYKEDKDFKMYNIYSDFIFYYVNIDTRKNYLNKNSENDIVLNSKNNNINTKNFNTPIQGLLNEAENKEKERQQLLRALQQEKSNHLRELAALYKYIEEYRRNLNLLKYEKATEIKRLSDTILDYKKKIIDLQLENENLLVNGNNKIQSLLRIIEEKNSIIQNLHKLLNVSGK